MESRARTGFTLKVSRSEVQNSCSDKSWALREGIIEKHSASLVGSRSLNDDESSESAVPLESVTFQENAIGVVFHHDQGLFNETPLLQEDAVLE